MVWEYRRLKGMTQGSRPLGSEPEQYLVRRGRLVIQGTDVVEDPANVYQRLHTTLFAQV